MDEAAPETIDTSEALAALLDHRRLMVAGALSGGVRTIDQLVEHIGLNRREVIEAVGALRQVGLVDAMDDGYVLPASKLRALAQSVGEAELPMDPWVGDGMTAAEQLVLSRFFRGRTLTQIPVDRPKRLIILERLALEFDVGRRYDEPTVNDLLRPFHPDVAALRRYLVDEDMFDRAHDADGTTLYWRSGGRVPSFS